MYLVGKFEHSVNAVQLSALLDITYKTAWRMLNKIRSVLSMESQQIWGEYIEVKHEIFNQQALLSDDRLQKERSVAIIKSVKRDENNCSSSFFAFQLLSRRKQAREVLEHSEQAEILIRLNLGGHSSVDMNPRFQQFQKRNTAGDLVNSGKRTCHPLSVIASNAFSWMKDKFHGIGDKYAQQYMDEYCLRLNASTGAITCAFEHTASLSLQMKH
ncbi:hypothetical protein [Paenibacillus sp. NPDC057967]|uniref:hypothetical protein n=1 Tax=Paenibacillus sp. NPDC057967 TaxID=3346293 RepID=UPI0036DC85ED